jgi:hypothetical protein
MNNKDQHYCKLFADDMEATDLKVLENIQAAALGIELGDGRPVRVAPDTKSVAEAPTVEKALDGYAETTLNDES